jgi:hypothetical protein
MRTFERCTNCGIPFFNGDKALWCKSRTCPETNQHYPTEKQVKELKIGEKEPRKLD